MALEAVQLLFALALLAYALCPLAAVLGIGRDMLLRKRVGLSCGSSSACSSSGVSTVSLMTALQEVKAP
jgi:hypothetical protein